MALIKCPECEREVSSSAEKCPHCGYPIADYLSNKDRNDEIERLQNKIIHIDYKVPAPRVKVCIKCGKPYEVIEKLNCKCGMPYIDVDYPEQQGGGLDSDKYILENCVIPMNIGDPESEEYKKQCKDLYESIRSSELTRQRLGMQNWIIVAEPPNPKYFGQTYTSRPLPSPPPPPPTPTNQPTCPICGSTSLSKISAVKKAAKISLFGIFGAGDLGKTWKCDKCGSKF